MIELLCNATLTRCPIEAGMECAVYESPWRGPHAPNWDKEQQRLAAWLRGLPKPLGLMACNDVRARHVLEAGRTIGVRVPEDVALIGVDNDEVFCALAAPSLSSIVLDTYQTGYAAAALLALLSALALGGCPSSPPPTEGGVPEAAAVDASRLP